MIRSFVHKGLEKFWKTGKTAGINPNLAANIRRKLDAMNAADSVGALDIPGLGLHPLLGNRAGEWAIKVTGNYRLTFRWEEPETEAAPSEATEAIARRVGAVEVQIEQTDDDEPGPAKVNLEDYH